MEPRLLANVLARGARRGRGTEGLGATSTRACVAIVPNAGREQASILEPYRSSKGSSRLPLRRFAEAALRSLSHFFSELLAEPSCGGKRAWNGLERKQSSQAHACG